MFLLLAPMASAADYPDIVRKAIEDARAQCVKFGGAPVDDRPRTVLADLDGNGGEDWILDYAEQDCKGGPSPFCGSAGCVLQIYLWQSGSHWELVFDHNVEAWKRLRIGGKPGLSVSFHGSVCNRPGIQRCHKKYIFERGELRPL